MVHRIKKTTLFVLSMALFSTNIYALDENNTVTNNAPNAYSIYFEQHGKHSIKGFSSEIIFNSQADTLSPYFMYGARLAHVERESTISSNNQEEKFASLVIGLGLSYGNPFNIYAEFGFDLGEFIAGEILNDDEEDSDSPVDVDLLFTLGAGYQFNNYISLSIYSKINRITGYTVRDNTSLYSGLKLSVFY